ncbi:MAG: hypothetical protein Q9195_005675 [Heterodermia aff. obscurata]
MTTPTVPIPQPITTAPDAAYKERDELAMLEGHDADIPVEEKPSTATNNSTTDQSPPSLESDDTRIKDEEQAVANTETKLETEDVGDIDPNIVSWDGPDDPENPINWKESLKWANVVAVSFITFITPLASSMFAPGIPDVMDEFHSTNNELASFVVSVYILGYAFGPLIIAPLSELYGRVVIYHTCNIMFVIFTVACAVASNLNMLIGFRFLQGTFGSAPLTIGGGSIADMIIQERRGAVMAVWAMGPLMGPVIGPVIGGYLSQAKGWRWVFWLIAIVAGTITIMGLFVLRETYPPVLLERKAKKLRKETGNQDLRSKLASDLTPTELFKLAIIRPAKLLFLSPIVLALSTFIAVVYGYLYLLFTTITNVFETVYHFSAGSVGLTYLGLGLGCFVGLFAFGMASDRIMKAKSAAGEMKPEYRLPPMIPGAWAIPAGFGVGLLATFMPTQTYLVDAFTLHAASALAANTVLRSLIGALLPLAGQQMYDTLGYGWGNSLLAFIAVAMCPIPWIFYRYGERIRKSPRFQVKL